MKGKQIMTRGELLEPRLCLTALPFLSLPNDEVQVPAELDGLLADPHRELFYVADVTHSQLRVIDASTGSQVRTVPTAGAPGIIAISVDGSTLLVTLPDSGQVQAISTQTFQSSGTIHVGQAVDAIVPVAGFSFYAVLHRDIDSVREFELSRFNYASGDRTQTIVSGVHRRITAATDTSGSLLYALGTTALEQSHHLKVFDAAAASSIGTEVRTYTLDNTAYPEAPALTIDSRDKRLYVSDMTSIQAVNLADASTVYWSMPMEYDWYRPTAARIISPPGSTYLYVQRTNATALQIRKTSGRAQAQLALGRDFVRSPSGRFLSTPGEVEHVPIDTIFLSGLPQLSLPDAYPSIKGTVFIDSNGNGVSDAQDEGEVGGRIYADLNNDRRLTPETEPFTYVNYASISHNIWRLFLREPGTYTLRVAIGESSLSTPIVETTQTHRVTVGTNQTVTGVRVGIAAAGFVDGHVFYDSNANGKLNPPEPNAITKVFLDLDLDGLLDEDEPVKGNSGLYDQEPLVSDYYSFSLVPNRTHVVRALQVDGKPFTNGGSAEVTAKSGELRTIDFGVDARQVMTGVVVTDLDGDGRVDQRESPLEGLTVWFDLNGNGKVNAEEPSAVTDASGTYRMTYVRDVNRRRPQFLLAGSRYFTARERPFYAELYQLETTVNFAVHRPVTLTVSVFEDFDRNRKLSKGDRRMAGHTVFLDYNHNGLRDSDEPSRIADTSGNAVFANLPPRSYTVAVIPPKRYGRVITKTVTISSGTNLRLPVS